MCLTPEEACTNPLCHKDKCRTVPSPSLWGESKGSQRLQWDLASTPKNNLVWECFPSSLWNEIHTNSEYKSEAKMPLLANKITLPVGPDRLKGRCRTAELEGTSEHQDQHKCFTDEVTTRCWEGAAAQEDPGLGTPFSSHSASQDDHLMSPCPGLSVTEVNSSLQEYLHWTRSHQRAFLVLIF